MVVLGDGKLGLLVAQILKQHAENVCLVGKHAEKMKLVEPAGISTTHLNELKDVTADLVVECTGTPSGLATAFEIVRPMGTIVVKSTINQSTEMDVTRMVVDEVTVLGSRCGPFLPALRALELRSVGVESLVSEERPLEQIVEAFDIARDRSTVKVLVRVT